MDVKRMKYSPSTYERLEEEYYDAILCGNMNTVLPDTYRGKAPTIWDELHNLYPAPASIQKVVDDFKFVRNWPGCSIYKRFICVFDDCLLSLDEEVTYFHDIMDEMDLASKSPAPLKCPALPSYEIEQRDLNAATGMVIRAVHVYEDYAIDGIFADFGPETPRFSALELRKTNAFAYEEAKNEEAKWIKRQQLTPTRLVFLP